MSSCCIVAQCCPKFYCDIRIYFGFLSHLFRWFFRCLLANKKDIKSEVNDLFNSVDPSVWGYPPLGIPGQVSDMTERSWISWCPASSFEVVLLKFLDYDYDYPVMDTLASGLLQDILHRLSEMVSGKKGFLSVSYEPFEDDRVGCLMVGV